MFLLDSNRYARDPNGVSNELNQMLQKCGGEILASRLWSEQKLAYPVDGHRKGTYWLTYFRLPSEKHNELTRACHLNEAILRNLILRVDPRLVDALVQHATTAQPSVASASEPGRGGPPTGRGRRSDLDEVPALDLEE
jgi:small subunit ribosomal protein S6